MFIAPAPDQSPGAPKRKREREGVKGRQKEEERETDGGGKLSEEGGGGFQKWINSSVPHSFKNSLLLASAVWLPSSFSSFFFPQCLAVL